MKENLEGKYVVVTVVSSFRQRYVVPTDELAKIEEKDTKEFNTSVAINRAETLVMLEDVKEFSQHWLGENIVDSHVVDEARMLEIFDADNQYIDDWTNEKKLSFARFWKQKQPKTEAE